MVQCKAVGATFSMDYKHSGDLEADGQGKAFWGQRIWSHLETWRGLKGRRKWLLPGEWEVWENRLYINDERDCSKNAEFLPTDCSSTQLASILPCSTITKKQERQTQILPLVNPGDMELWTQSRQNGDQKWSGYPQDAVSEGAGKVPSKVRSTTRGRESKSLVLNSGKRLQNAVCLSLPGPNFILRSRWGWVE